MNIKRRSCKIITESDLLNDFQRCNFRICQKYKQTSKEIMIKGIAVLQRIAASYLNSRKILNNSNFTFNGQSFGQKSVIHMISGKKQLINEQDNDNFKPYMSNIKPKIIKSEYKTKQKQDLQYMLEEQIKQISNNKQIQYMSLQQLIEDSNKKIQQKKQRQGYTLDDVMQQQDSSYPLTDYDSNESSNQNSYHEEYKEQMKYSDYVMQDQQSQNNNYKLNNIMYSPKKDKNQYSKRLYIRNKKIPKWAMDLQKIKQIVISQCKNVEFDIKKIYGTCVAQKIDSNVIFKRCELYMRGSSAKWDRNVDYQFQS